MMRFRSFWVKAMAAAMRAVSVPTTATVCMAAGASSKRG
jgi:hypothetical protein